MSVLAYSVKRKSNQINTAVLLITMFLVIVFPNTFRAAKVGLFAIILLFARSYFFKIPKKIWTIYLAGILVTFIYLLVGLAKATQPYESTTQIIVVYILSPLFWLLLSFYLIKNYKIETIIKILNIYAIIGSSTVLIGIWLYYIGYKNILAYIIENPNETFTDSGVAAIRFHVYGSLIFLFPALLQLYNKFKGFKYILLLVLLVIVSIVSGRDALILSIIIGLLVFTILSRGIFIKYAVYLIPAAFLLVVILQYYGVNVTNTISLFFIKIQAGGGAEISKQYLALLKGINNNYFLGSGHGVGVDVIRSIDYPWRYELLPMATIFRVGFIGFIIYALPAIIAVLAFIKKFTARSNTIYDNYFFAGLISLCAASFTNPYLESFEFQWGYFFVFVYFIAYPFKPAGMQLKSSSLV